MLFREEDDSFLPNEYEDGHVVEKKEYVPILPMLLVNGASGLASGWSSKVPPHNPVVLADWIRVWLTRRERQESGGTEPNELELESVPESESESKSEQSPTDMESSLPVFPTLLPWWRGFKGTVRTTNQSNRFLIWGAISKLPAPNVLSKTQTIVQVNEIPLGMASISIKKYRKILEQMRDAGKLDFVDHSDSFQIDFKVLIKSNSIDMETSTDDEIMLFLKLRSWFASQLVCLTGTPTEIVRYNTVEEILDKYCERRLELFETVRQGQIQKTLHQIEVEQNKQRFIQAVVDKVIVLSDYEDSEIERKLEQMKFMVDPDKGKGYTYLLEMAVRSITKTRIQALKDKIVRLQVKLSELRMSTRFGIWRQCLRTWQDTWIDWVSTEEALNVKSRTKKEGGGRGTGGNKTSRTKTRVGKK
jgi:DNA topoisomerase-2